ncbi:MAG TPA: CHAT domain-containing protein, partial [Candidatus Eisenbacteria bacterium]|nr:CHAT domain-containing protein [Candidatus Eisenbacteria bacterium]
CSVPSSPGLRGIGGTVPSQRVRGSSPNATNPLRLSGLVLAGANQRRAVPHGEEDGILTSEEIASLDLSGVEWAVLSACETGGGDFVAREGVLGLSRAFRAAQVGTLIVSLWPVEDSFARTWMTYLYEGRFRKGLGTAEAVRAATLSVLRDRRARGMSTHPFHWSAFIATGNWN